MRFDSIIVVTYGRSGSTLLQGVLNSIPGVLVRGENTNFCFGLFQAYKRLRETHATYGKGARHPTHPWFGASELDLNRFLADSWSLVQGQLGVAPVLGFKEIRYFEVPDLNGYLDFLTQLFPAPAFIFLTRDLDNVCQSGWWKDQPKDAVTQRLRKFESAILTYSSGRNDFFHISYEQMVERQDSLRNLFEFLGAPYDEAAIERVLSQTHSSVTEKIVHAEG